MMSPAKALTLFIILPVALTLDIVGIILVCFGLDDFGITDVIGLAVIGGWFFGLSQFTGKPAEVQLPPAERRAELKKATKEISAGFKKTGGKTAKTAKWVGRAKWLRPLFICLEFIPYLGCFFWWTIWVIVELKNLRV